MAEVCVTRHTGITDGQLSLDTKAGTILSSATPQQVMDRRAKALEASNTNAAPAAAPKPKVA